MLKERELPKKLSYLDFRSSLYSPYVGLEHSLQFLELRSMGPNWKLL